MNPRARALIVICFLFVLTTAAQTISSRRQNSGSFSGSPIAYVFDCAGEYHRIDLGRGSAKEGIVRDLPTSGSSRFDGCRIDAAKWDSAAGYLYVITPTTATVDAEGHQSYELISFSLPSLTVLGREELPHALQESPSLLLDEKHDQVVVAYTLPGVDPTGTHGVITRYARATLQNEGSLNTPEIRGQAVLNLSSSVGSKAYIDSMGRIVANNSILDQNGIATQTVSGYSLLGDSIRQQFRGLRRPGATGQPFLDIAFADSGNDQLLFTINWDTFSDQSPMGGGLLVYNINTGKVTASWSTPYRQAPFDGSIGTPTVHLTPDGKVAIVEEYDWRQSDLSFGGTSSGDARFKTGVLVFYDASSGSLIRTIQLNPVPGYFGRVLGVSADSAIVYYASDQNIYAVEVASGETQVFRLPKEFLPVAVVSAAR